MNDALAVHFGPVDPMIRPRLDIVRAAVRVASPARPAELPATTPPKTPSRSTKRP